MTTGCIVLAGGAGTRMKSDKPKVLCEVLRKPMLDWVLDAAENFGFDKIAVVTGFRHELTEAHVKSRSPEIQTFFQREQRGTGDAVMAAGDFIAQTDRICVLNGDAPFIDSAALRDALSLHEQSGADATVISAVLPNPFGYGRIIRENGEFTAIREQKDCSPEEEKICEVNSGAYWFSSAALLDALPRLSAENAAGEYYLTDCIGIIGNAAAFVCAAPDIVLGANTRRALYELNETARARVLYGLMDEGVEFVSLDGIIISPDAIIGKDTVVLPNTVILGKTKIGCGCVIGANSHIEDCIIGNGVVLNNVQAYSSTVEDGARIGPFAQLRPGTIIRSGVKIGDFVEIKNSDIGEKTSVAHLTYLGDSTVGRDVNFGCGCVTANYDGIEKYRTQIGDHAFIGCNTNLIAPVKIGDNAATGAGSTITEDVPADALAVERSRVRIKEKWEKNFLRRKK